jgi:membrane protein DedA with SNARE-associated domain
MTSFFTHHGLPLLFAAVAIESLGIPVPGETALIVWATGVGLLAYFGGKALADTVGRYGLYAGAVIVFALALLVAGRKRNRRRRMDRAEPRSCASHAEGDYS